MEEKSHFRFTRHGRWRQFGWTVLKRTARQGVFRDPTTPEFAAARQAIEGRGWMTVDLLYGDYEGGQRVISRFSLQPREDGGWISGIGRHWNLDTPDPR
ncbi:MAG: hypothetical protein M3P15_02985 [Actinomycetota bacterium]|nr:hypothetical protein [Actinomycetota bacterium]